MTHTPDEIAAMIEVLEYRGAGHVLGFGHMIGGKAAAMLRDVAAERDAMAAEVERLAGAWKNKHAYQVSEAKSHRDYFEKSQHRMYELCENATKAEAERDRLAAMVEKLRGYAVHDDECGVNALLMPRLPMTKQCTCGLSDVLKEGENGQ